MASIGNDPGGLRRILFFDPNGKRRTLRLGKVSKRQAEAVKCHVEQIVAAGITRTALPAETSRWIASLDAVLRDRLAAVGLAERRERLTLGGYVASFIAGRNDVKPGTIAKWRTTEKALLEYFGADMPLERITAGDADEWRRKITPGHAENTIRKYVAIAKVFFNAAKRKGLIAESPFADQKASILPNASRLHFVTRETAAEVLAACPNAEWRLIFALSRFGGLRCPSVHLALRWGDIDWEGNRMTVHASKTEHHVGGGLRFLPLFPELRPHLEAAFDEAFEDARGVAPDDTAPVIRQRGPGAAVNLRTQFERIMARAGIATWPKLFQNLRSTRQTELEADFPLHVVCAWIGNSPRVAQKHYLQVTDAHFAKATAAHHPAQQAQATDGTERKSSFVDPENARLLPLHAVLCRTVHDYTVAEAGVEPARPLRNIGF
jgi:integrase